MYLRRGIVMRTVKLERASLISELRIHNDSIIYTQNSSPCAFIKVESFFSPVSTTTLATSTFCGLVLGDGGCLPIVLPPLKKKEEIKPTKEL